MKVCMFKVFAALCLALITYGVLYRNLPCEAQLFDKTFYCQLKASAEHDHEVYLERVRLREAKAKPR